MLDFTLVPKLLGFFRWNYSRELVLLSFFFLGGGGEGGGKQEISLKLEEGMVARI